MGEQRDATFSHYSDQHMPSSSHQLTNTSREILTTEPPRTAIDGLQLRHSFFPPKRLDIKMPLQSIGRYRKSTYNSFSGRI